MLILLAKKEDLKSRIEHFVSAKLAPSLKGEEKATLSSNIENNKPIFVGNWCIGWKARPDGFIKIIFEHVNSIKKEDLDQIKTSGTASIVEDLLLRNAQQGDSQ